MRLHHFCSIRPSSDIVLLPCRTKLSLGSTVARQKQDSDSDVVPESYQIQEYWINVTISQRWSNKNGAVFQKLSKKSNRKKTFPFASTANVCLFARLVSENLLISDSDPSSPCSLLLVLSTSLNETSSTCFLAEKYSLYSFGWPPWFLPSGKNKIQFAFF